MSEGLMAYNNISSGSDTGVKKITETKMIESGAEYTFGTDNHKQMTYKSLITFSGPTNAILIKIEIPSYSLYCFDCKAYDSYPCNSFEDNTYVRYGGTSDITSASISIWKINLEMCNLFQSHLALLQRHHILLHVVYMVVVMHLDPKHI